MTRRLIDFALSAAGFVLLAHYADLVVMFGVALVSYGIRVSK